MRRNPGYVVNDVAECFMREKHCWRAGGGKQPGASQERETQKKTETRGGTSQGRVTPRTLPGQTSSAGCITNTNTDTHTYKVGAYPYISLSGDGFPCVQVNHLRCAI